ncbi:50S ribosomal protein L3 [Candidatus Parcubacteria bacterium]|nr:MAG: 50S ribosomal protein L3 [Candidatus Parcubacteria bacterium]
MKVILGKKIGMTRVFDSKGKAVAVTIIEANPVVVSAVKTKESDGYYGVQLGFGINKRPSRPLGGQIKKSGLKEVPKKLKEFRLPENKKDSFKVGDGVSVSAFAVGDKVVVSGVSKAKGFQGVMKRHGFSGGSASHGQKHSAREPGSIGATGPQRVLKGTKMAGRMGGDRVTIKNLEIVRVDEKNNLLAIRGAIPGPKGRLIEIRA